MLDTFGREARRAHKRASRIPPLGRGSTCGTYSRSGSAATGEWAGKEVASSPFLFANTDLAILGSDLVRRVLHGRCLASFDYSFSRAEASKKFIRRRVSSWDQRGTKGDSAALGWRHQAAGDIKMLPGKEGSVALKRAALLPE